MCMPRINVYLSDELAAAARPLGLNLSNVLQDALREQLVSRRIDAWLDALGPPTAIRGAHLAALRALERVVGEPDRA